MNALFLTIVVQLEDQEPVAVSGYLEDGEPASMALVRIGKFLFEKKYVLLGKVIVNAKKVAA